MKEVNQTFVFRAASDFVVVNASSKIEPLVPTLQNVFGYCKDEFSP